MRPRKGQVCQTGSVCVSCGVAPLEFAVSQGRREAGELHSLPGFLEKHTSKCCSLKLLCGERPGVTLSAASRRLAEQVVFTSSDFRNLHCVELLKLFLIVTSSLANCLVSSRCIQFDSQKQCQFKNEHGIWTSKPCL